MTTPSRFLFAITDGGGTVPPDTSVARALVQRGHDVRVLADRVLAPDVASTGAEHVVWDTAPQRPDLEPTSTVIRDWDAKTPLGAFAAARDGLMTGPAAQFAADVRAELRRRPADVVVCNLFLFGAQIAAEAQDVPVAMLAPNLAGLPGWGIPPLGSGLPQATGTARPAARRRRRARDVLELRPRARGPQRGAPRERPRRHRSRAGQLRARRPLPHPHERGVRLRQLQPAGERAGHGTAPGGSGVGRRVDGAGGRRPARARVAELDVHGPGEGAAAHRHRPRRAAGARPDHHGPVDRPRRDRRRRPT